MKTRTTIEAITSSHKISRGDTLVALGSCFATEIGGMLVKDGFDCLVNPYGVAFNPASIQNQINGLLQGQELLKAHFVERDGYHAHLDYHSKIRGKDQADLRSHLVKVNQTLLEQLKEASTVLLTFGTAYVFEYIPTGRIVANCHKVPGQAFRRTLLTVDKCQDYMQQIVASIRSINPDVQFICTVSPVRHIRDTLVGNSKSKAHLLTSLHNVIENNAHCHYFPSYEILMDELRDYRYYKNDMIHPTEEAVGYVWERFRENFLLDIN